MFNPIIVLYTYFPEKLAFRVLLVAIMAASFTALFDLLWRKGRLSRNKSRVYTLLFLYVSALLFVIVLGRRTQLYTRVELNPFIGYQKLLISDSIRDWGETVLNVVAFVPVGFLTCVVTKRARAVKAVLFGSTLSVLFESLQFFMRNGYCETRYVINNTFGALFGAVLGIICIIIVSKRKAD